VLVLLLPYIILWLYFSWRDKKNEIERLSGLEQNHGYSSAMYGFHDEKGVLRFSVKTNDLLYIEAAHIKNIFRGCFESLFAGFPVRISGTEFG